jgi:hypothetical protein
MVRRQIPDQEIWIGCCIRWSMPGAAGGAGIALRTGDVDIVYVNGYGFPPGGAVRCTGRSTADWGV